MTFSLKPVESGNDYRQHELDSVLKSVRQKKNVCVIAAKKMGKSSFLLEINDSLSKQNNYSPILYTKDGCTDLSSYIRKNLSRLLKQHPEKFTDIKKIISASLIDIDSILSEINSSENVKKNLRILLLFFHDESLALEALSALFALPEFLASDLKQQSVILIDDCDLLGDIKSDKHSADVFLQLQKEGRFSGSIFIISSSRRFGLENFEEQLLSAFSVDASRRFFSDNNFKLTEPAFNTIYNMTGGIPFYLNFFGRIAQKTNVYDPEGINLLMQDALDNELGIYYSERVKQLSPKELPILFCMAEHDVNTPSRISKILNYSQTNVRRFLSIMEEKGFVALQDRGVFEIYDPVLKRWLGIQAAR